MAKGIGALFSLEARGSIRKTITYLNKRGSTVIQRIPKHPDRESEDQLAQREVFSYYVEAWNELSDEERAAYPGTPELTPYQHFMQVGLQAGLPPPEPSIKDSWTEHDIDSFYATAWWDHAQTWTPSNAYTMTKVKLLIYRVGSPGTVTLSITEVDGEGAPTGEDLDSVDINGDLLTDDPAGEWAEFDGFELMVSPAAQKALVLRSRGGDPFDDQVHWRFSTPDPDGGDPADYEGGQGYKSYTPFVDWDPHSVYYNWDPYTVDFLFEIWGFEPGHVK